MLRLKQAVLMLVACAMCVVGGAGCRADEPAAEAVVQGTPPGLVLHKFEDAVPHLGPDFMQGIQPGMVYGFNEPLLVRANAGAYQKLSVHPKNLRTGQESTLAQEYGVRDDVLWSEPFLAPDENNPYGVKGMFGYRSKEGFRCEEVKLSVLHVDIAELVRPDGGKEMLVAVAGGLTFKVNRGTGVGSHALTIPPYRWTRPNVIELYRVKKPAEGEKPVIERILSYSHPGDIYDLAIEQWQTLDGINHIICLFAGADFRIGVTAQHNAEINGTTMYSSGTPSVGYLSFFPKGPTFFGDEGVTRIDDQPWGVSYGPTGAHVKCVPPGDAYFGYLEDGELYPFPWVDLTQWQGNMDYGYRIPPVPAEMPSASKDGIRVLYAARLHDDGMIDTTTALKTIRDSWVWVLEPEGTVNLRYRMTADGQIVRAGMSPALRRIIGAP